MRRGLIIIIFVGTILCLNSLVLAFEPDVPYLPSSYRRSDDYTLKAPLIQEPSSSNWWGSSSCPYNRSPAWDIYLRILKEIGAEEELARALGISVKELQALLKQGKIGVKKLAMMLQKAGIGPEKLVAIFQKGVEDNNLNEANLKNICNYLKELGFSTEDIELILGKKILLEEKEDEREKTEPGLLTGKLKGGK